MYLIGIAGQIASGKSTIAEFVRKLGYTLIDADHITHQVLEEDDDLWAKLVTRYGDEIVDHEGKINRSALADIVFNDEEELTYLEQQSHPLIVDRILGELSKVSKNKKQQIVFIEAALLFKTDLPRLLNEIWWIDAPVDQRRERLINQRFLSEEEADTRLAASRMPPESQLGNCTRIDNSESIQYTHAQVSKILWQALEAAKKANTAS
jgi:dephospho-CoA kinase